MDYEGGCQCGRIRYRAEGPRDRASLCFCRMCQKAGGAPFMAFVRFPAASVTWSEPPATFASSAKVERGFCSSCGTPLTYRQIDGPNVSLTLNSLDRPGTVEPDMTFYAEQKPTWLNRVQMLPDEMMDLAGASGFASHQHPDTPEHS